MTWSSTWSRTSTSRECSEFAEHAAIRTARSYTFQRELLGGGDMRVSMKFAILAACAGLGMSAGGPPWLKLDRAKAAAVESGKPLAVYATVDGKDASGC